MTTPTFPLTYPCPGCRADVPSRATHCPACGMHLRDDREFATPAERMRAACELNAEGAEHYRQRMISENPDANPPETAPDPGINVTMTVTVRMTPEQCDAYSEAHGAGFAGLEIMGRSRGEFREAIQQIPWVRKFATISITKPHWVTTTPEAEG